MLAVPLNVDGTFTINIRIAILISHNHRVAHSRLMLLLDVLSLAAGCLIVGLKTVSIASHKQLVS